MWTFFRKNMEAFRQIPFVRDVFTLQLGSGLYFTATFLSSIAFARLLGVEEYGTYAVILAFAGTASNLLNLGQSSSLLVFFAEEYGKKSKSGMATVLKNFAQVAATNGVVLIMLALAAPKISDLLYGDPRVGMLARVLFLFQAIDVWNSMLLIILQAIRRIRLKVLLEQAANLTFLCTAVTVLFFGAGIRGIFASQLCISLLFLIISYCTYRIVGRKENLPSLHHLRSIPTSATIPYFTQGILFSVEKNIGNLFPQGIFFLLSTVAPASAIGLARIAVQFANLPRQFLLAPVGDLSTTVLANQKAQGMGVIRRNAAKIVKHTLAMFTAMNIGIGIVLPVAVPLLYGREFAPVTYTAWWLLLFSTFGALAVVNSPLLRLFRMVHYSIAQALVSWTLVLIVIFTLKDTLVPLTIFIIAYGTGQILPLTITYVLFSRKLVYAPTSDTAKIQTPK
jgi:O-antigen/teichoic acid export membrane protein